MLDRLSRWRWNRSLAPVLVALERLVITWNQAQSSNADEAARAHTEFGFRQHDVQNLVLRLFPSAEAAARAGSRPEWTEPVAKILDKASPAGGLLLVPLLKTGYRPPAPGQADPALLLRATTDAAGRVCVISQSRLAGLDGVGLYERLPTLVAQRHVLPPFP